MQLKAAATDTLTDRIRMDQIANDLVLLSQGIPFFQVGQDMLRSKSFDENSYNSGDWWNRLDWSYQANNFGVGLPPTGDSNWPIYKPLLANPALKPSAAQIQAAVVRFQEMLRIRKSSPLFRLRTAADVQERLSFLNTGADQTPGLIVMRLSDPRAIRLDNPYAQIVVVFNATGEAKQVSADALKNANLQLHPIQAASADPLVRTASFASASGTLSVPARTTAVFVQASYQLALPVVGR